MTDRFTKVVQAYGTPNWSRLMAEITREAYAPKINESEVINATPGHLVERFRSGYEIEGETAKKAMRFYVMALKDAGKPVSPHIRLKERKGGMTRRRRPTNGGEVQEETKEEPRHKDEHGMLRFPVPIPGKTQATITVPEDLTEPEWAMIDMYVRNYIALRTTKKTPARKTPEEQK